MKFLVSTYLIIFGLSIGLFSQNTRTLKALYITEKPKIDGLLLEDFWKNTPTQDNFVQFEPFNNSQPSQQTFVKFAYDDNAIYIAAICKIGDKGKLYSILSSRDDFGQADYFGFYLDPYNTGITGYGFFVTAAGVQIDLKVDNTTLNYNWDAVWYSAVTKSDSGYIVEMKIPFSAFRFPRKDKNSWHINFYRNIQQHREISTWNYVDNSKNGILNQMGTVENLKNINPPVYIEIMPHISAYIQKNSTYDKFAEFYGAGLDFKYGINESFTLDMMLVPDFAQIQTDDQVLNLSPYEVYYDEKRPFFTEGNEIFNKGNIFYSRRIGKRPTKYDDVADMIDDNEIIIKNPDQTQILNATKFSGKTDKGLGIGIINAFTLSTYAVIYDTVFNKQRTILTEPLANYNIFAINKPLRNNSYVSLTNTNFASFGRNYYSDVIAQELLHRNKKNSWALFERFSTSNIFNDTIKPDIGFAYSLSISKTSGNFRPSISQTLYSDNYNPNNLGYLRQNNIVNTRLNIAYNIYKPHGYFLLWRNSVSISYRRLYDSLRYVGTEINFYSSTKLKNFTSIGFTGTYTPDVVYDYFEPRAEDKYYVKEPPKKITFWVSTNYAKNLANDLRINFYFAGNQDKSQKGYSFLYSPRIRLSNKALFVYSIELRYDFNDIGFVGKSESGDSIFFGKRNIKYTTNTISFDYNFTKNIFLNAKIRHYWSLIDYYEYYSLSNTGLLYPLNYSYHFTVNQDINYNNFTVDLNFRWIFLPGSEFSITFKKLVVSNTNDLIADYYDNFENMYFSTPRLNSLTFKLSFYINPGRYIKRKP